MDASTGSTDARADGSSDGCRSTCQPLLLAHVLAMFIELQGDDVFLGALSPPNLATVTSILKVAKSGGTVTTLQSGLVGVRSFAVDATNVYFVAGVSVPDSATYAAKLMTTSVDGGSPVALADAEGSAIGTVVADGRVYWGGYSDSLGLSWFSIGASVDGGSRSGTFDVNARAPYAVTADSRYVYWQASKPTGALVRAPLAGGSVETLQGASGVGLCAEIAVSGDFLFCTDFSHRKLVRVPLNEPYQYIPPIDSNLVPRFAIDDQFIYWISSSTHSIERARFDGTDAVTVVSRTSGIGDLAVDATGIYWTEWDVADATISSGSVMKLEK